MISAMSNGHHNKPSHRSHALRSVSRRTYLGAASSAAIGGIIGTGSAVADSGKVAPGCRRPFDYDHVVNVVEAGGDPEGTTPVDPIVEAHIEDNTLVYFPEGEYRVENLHFEDVHDFGLCGRNATLVPLDGETGNWITTVGVTNFQFDGFHLDHTAEDTGPSLFFRADDGLLVRDVHKEGLHQSGARAFRPQIDEIGGAGLIENVRFPDGTDSGAVGILLTSPASATTHWGHLTFKNCHVEGFMDNGLYASGPIPPATVHVIGGYYANNNIANIRLGPAGSFIQGAEVEVRKVPDYWDDSMPINMRGIRLIDGEDITIKGCTVHKSAPAAGAPISIGTRFGNATIKNTRVRHDAPSRASRSIDGRIPWDHPEYPDRDFSLELRNVRITGDAENRFAIDHFNRGHSEFKNLCIQQTGTTDAGIRFASIEHDGMWVPSTAEITNAIIDVPTDPIAVVAEAEEPETTGVRFHGECEDVWAQ